MQINLLQVVFNGLTEFAIYSLFSVGLSLIFGVMKLPNMAQGILFSLGAIIHYDLTIKYHIPFMVSMGLTIVIMFVIGMALQRFVVARAMRTQVLAMITGIGISYLLSNFLINVWGAWPLRIPNPWSQVITVLDASITLHKVLCLIISLSAMTILWLFLNKTKMGVAIRSVSQDPETATLMGVNVKTIFMVVFGIGISFAAIGGVLMGLIIGVNSVMGDSVGNMGLAIIVLGGMGSFAGAIIGALIVAFVDVFVATYVSSFYGLVIAFSVMIVVVLIRPQGLFGKKARTA